MNEMLPLRKRQILKGVIVLSFSNQMAAILDFVVVAVVLLWT